MKSYYNDGLIAILLFIYALSLTLIVYANPWPVAPIVAANVSAPSNPISVDQIKVYNTHVLINQSGLSYFTVAPTGSMKPFIDNGSYVLAKNITGDTLLHKGDIVTYYNHNDSYIMHRIIGIQEDSNGTYYTLKGDNNNIDDPDRVRREDMRFIVAGVIY